MVNHEGGFRQHQERQWETLQATRGIIRRQGINNTNSKMDLELDVTWYAKQGKGDSTALKKDESVYANAISPQDFSRDLKQLMKAE